jgi:LPS-assembly protein
MSIRAALTAFTACFFILISYAYAVETHISADSMERRGNIYEAEGSVRIERGGAAIETGKARYDADTGEAVLEGGVLYTDPDIEIRAERASLNLNTHTGVLYDAYIFVKGDNFHIRSEEVRKTGERTYTLKKASITTCDAPVPAWCMRGRDMEVVLGDKVSARHASFSIKGIPVLYTPYIQAPMLTERKTGLLFPTFGYRKEKGLYIRQPFFWAISENRDATFYLDYYSQRGLGEAVEYRYIESPGVKGSLYAGHLRDREVKEDFLELRARHEHWGRTVSGRLDLNLLNRREFYRLYEPYLEQSSKRFLESRAEVFANLDKARLYVLGQYSYDLKEGADESTIPQRLPGAGVFLNPVPLGPLAFTASMAASNFQRETGPSGQRYDMRLKLEHSMGKALILSQSVSGRGTLYDLDEDNFGQEGLDYRAALRTRFIRHYKTLSHAVEPSVSYMYATTWGKEPPLFDVLELAPEEASIAELALMNRLMDRRGELLTLRVSQAVDTREEDRPLLPLRLDLSVQRPLNVKASLQYDLYEGFITQADSSLGLEFWRLSLSAGQSYTRSANVALYSLLAGLRASRALTLRSGIKYDSQGGGIRELIAGLTYLAQCWGVEVDYVKKPDDFNIFLRISLKGLGSFGGT